MARSGLFLFAAVLLILNGKRIYTCILLGCKCANCYNAGSDGTELGASSWNKMLADLMQAANNGVCNDYCYIVVDGKRHFFQEDFVNRDEPCVQYICRVRTI